jgi:prevent-host-death family protein
MARVNVHDAKTHLSRLIVRALRGEEVVIARNGHPAVKLVPVANRKRKTFGIGKGTIKFHGDVNDPLPNDVVDGFYNSTIFPDG